ncbi:subunit of the GINS complex [Backusella circina FSU 941]|nr:subunit of the GINS complex [Backusella circina FSU 941]
MTTLGDASYKLAKEAKRTADLVISPYNDTLVQSICREIRLLHNKAEQTVTQMREDTTGDALHDPNNMSQVMLYHLAVKRNKRVLFAYHRQRMNKLKELSWNVGLKSDYQRSIKNDLGKTEHKFLQEYNEILNTYKHSFMEVDIGGNGGAGLDPPVDLYIEVRVVRNGGEVNTEYGVLNLSMGNQFYVRRTDVEGLIKAGYLKHV